MHEQVVRQRADRRGGNAGDGRETGSFKYRIEVSITPLARRGIVDVQRSET